MLLLKGELNFIDKEPCTKFCDVLISSLQSFESVCEWRHRREYAKHFTPGFFCIFLLVLRRKNLPQFYCRFDRFA